jgi:hypothetical protein
MSSVLRLFCVGVGCVVTVGLAGCGSNPGVAATPIAEADVTVSQLPCLVRPNTFPGPGVMPIAAIRAQPLSYGNSIEYLGRTNPDPGYEGFGEAVYAWKGLVSGPAARFDTPNASETSGNQAHVDNLPSSGPLFTRYPTQILTISLEVDDYGSVAAAKSWLAESRQDYPVNDIPIEASGLTRYPSVPNLGDDTFAMQLDRSSAGGSGATPYIGAFVGDVYTDIEIRDGSYVYSVGIDAPPEADAVSAATKLVGMLIAGQEAACSSSASGAPTK